MALTTSAKAQLVQEYQRSPGDTGSSEVQIALLSSDINLLTQHIKANKHDHHSERGLLLKVSKRNRLLRYLKRTSGDSYYRLIKQLGLRDKA